MVFRDQMLTCEECGKTFFFTVTDQRRIADRTGTDQVEAPALCPQCRAGPQAQTDMIAPTREEEPVAQAEEIAADVEEATGPGVEAEFPLEEEGIQVKLIGTVKWFSREKGYGFITKADGKDLFFHRADLARDEHAWPREGEKVEFQVRYTAKGPEAFNVSILPTD
jgi:CspA family cold shock protein